MSTNLYTSEERELLETWFEGKSLSIEDEDLLEEWGFDHDPCEAYTRLDAWVGAFAVRDIQERLPNCGICREDGVVLTRPIVEEPAIEAGRGCGAVPVPDQLGGLGAGVELAGGLSPRSGCRGSTAGC